FRQQPQILISAAMMTLFGFRQAKFIGLWIPFVMLSMYFTMVGLARARLKLIGIGFHARVAVVLAAATGLFFVFRQTFINASIGRIDSMNTPGAFQVIDSPLHAPIINAILFIPRFFATAALPKTLGQQLVSCAVLLVMAALFFVIAAQLNVSFEEASLRASERQLARIDRVRGQRFGRRVLIRRIDR